MLRVNEFPRRRLGRHRRPAGRHGGPTPTLANYATLQLLLQSWLVMVACSGCAASIGKKPRRSPPRDRSIIILQLNQKKTRSKRKEKVSPHHSRPKYTKPNQQPSDPPGTRLHFPHRELSKFLPLVHCLRSTQPDEDDDQSPVSTAPAARRP